MKKIVNIVRWLIVLVLLLSAVAIVLSNFNTPLRFRIFNVASGSMEPALPIGSLVIVNPAENYKEKDIITFKSENKPKDTVTHRIAKIEKDKDLKTINYQTKGDANEDPDITLVTQRRVIGKVILTMPLLGYAVEFTKTQIGLIVLIIIPSTIIAYSEVQSIKKEITKLIKSKRKKKNEKDN